MKDPLAHPISPTTKATATSSHQHHFQLIKFHKMTRRQVEKEMAAIGLLPEEIIETLPQQHLMIFQKAGSSG